MSDDTPLSEYAEPEGTLPPRRSPSVQQPPQWDPVAAVSFGWHRVTGDLSIIGVLLVGGLIASFVSIVGAVVSVAVGEDGQWISWVADIINLPIACWIGMGMIRYALKELRHDSGELSDLFTGGPFWTYLIAYLLTLAIVVGGTILCIVPGVIAALGLWFTLTIVVDRDVRAFDALAASWRLTTGHKGLLFVFLLLAILISLAGLLACGVGIIFTNALLYVASTWIYLRLCGEEPALPQR